MSNRAACLVIDTLNYFTDGCHAPRLRGHAHASVKHGTRTTTTYDDPCNFLSRVGLRWFWVPNPAPNALPQKISAKLMALVKQASIRKPHDADRA